MDLNTIIVVLLGAVCVLAVAFGVYAMNMRKRFLEQSEAIRKLQQAQHSAQLNIVETTLNPHLFKNVLNSIQSHAYQTYFALDKLATVLDYILYDSRQPFVSPKEEILFAQNLIEINKIKLSPLFELQVRLRINELDEQYLQKTMAPLISIDLIENAFKHADIQNPDSFIKISISLEHGVFTLSVANKVSERPPLPKEKGGLGSPTLDQRLDVIYGRHYSLQRLQENDQYIAHLKVNLSDYQSEMRTAG